MPNKIGIHLGYAPAYHDWIQIAAVKANGFVVLDGFDLPDDWLPQHTVVYRGGSDVKRVVREWEPVRYARYLRAIWQGKAGRFFNDAIFLNEPNAPEESGYSNPAEAIALTISWGLACVAELRYQWPGKRIHSPPLSPSPQYGDWRQLYEQMRPLIEACDVLDVHSYFGNAVNLAELHAMYPGKPMVISECGRPGRGTRQYGQELVQYWRSLPHFIEWAAPFIWCAPPGDWTDWVLQGTAAARVILEAEL